MINYKGDFTPTKSVSVELLPAGAYVGKIIATRLEDYNANGTPAQRLVLAMDVTEGEHADHYTKQLEAQSGGMYPAKFKGTLRINIPRQGDQYEAMNKRMLEHAIWCIEDSNKGYKWNWNEETLEGKAVGFSVRERDWIMEDENGKITSGTTTEIGRLESVNDVRAGTVKPMKKRELRDADKAKLAAAQAPQFAVVDDDELPF